MSCVVLAANRGLAVKPAPSHRKRLRRCMAPGYNHLIGSRYFESYLRFAVLSDRLVSLPDVGRLILPIPVGLEFATAVPALAVLLFVPALLVFDQLVLIGTFHPLVLSSAFSSVLLFLPALRFPSSAEYFPAVYPIPVPKSVLALLILLALLVPAPTIPTVLLV